MSAATRSWGSLLRRLLGAVPNALARVATPPHRASGHAAPCPTPRRLSQPSVTRPMPLRSRRWQVACKTWSGEKPARPARRSPPRREAGRPRRLPPRCGYLPQRLQGPYQVRLREVARAEYPAIGRRCARGLRQIPTIERLYNRAQGPPRKEHCGRGGHSPWVPRRRCWHGRLGALGVGSSWKSRTLILQLAEP